MLQSISRGFIFGTYAYLKNPWEALDFFVTMVHAFLKIARNYDRTFPAPHEIDSLHGFRILKVITRLPGVQVMAQGLLHAMQMTIGIVFTMILVVLSSSLVAKEAFGGVLLQKCVRNYNPAEGNYSDFINNEKNWQIDMRDDPVVCGNDSGAQHCSPGYVCLPNIGKNPGDTYGNFDNFAWSFFNTFRILTLDEWEDLYKWVLNASGSLSILFFVPAVVFGAFYMMNLILAVVANAYQEVVNQKEISLSQCRTNNVFPFELDNLDLYVYPTNPEVMLMVLEHRNATRQRHRNDCYSPAYRDWGSMARTAGRAAVVVKRMSVHKFRSSVHDEEEEETPIETGRMSSFKKYIKPVRLKVRAFTENPWFRLLILICVIVNLVALGTEHYGMSVRLRENLRIINLSITVIYCVEELLYFIGCGRDYFRDWWNLLDFFITAASVVSLFYENVAEVSLLRLIRVFRIIKLAHAWRSLREVVNVIFSSLTNLLTLCAIVAMILFVFSMMILCLFVQHVGEEGSVHHFTLDDSDPESFYVKGNIPWSYRHQIVLGSVSFEIPPRNETVFYARWHFYSYSGAMFTVFRIFLGEWVQPMSDCMNDAPEIDKFKCPLVVFICLLSGDLIIFNLFIVLLIDAFEKKDIGLGTDSKVNPITAFVKDLFRPFMRKRKENSEETKVVPEIILHDMPEPAVSKGPWRLGCLRIKVRINHLVTSSHFEGLVILIILLNCITLALKNQFMRRDAAMVYVFFYLDIVFTVIYVIEMFLRIIGLGAKQYFSDTWNILDLVIILLSILDIGLVYLNNFKLYGLYSVKAVRALRPLRFISQWKGVQMVAMAVTMSLPPLIQVILVCLTIWLIFAIIGVHMFAGRLFACVDDEGYRYNPMYVANKTQCLEMNLTWAQPFANFDNIGRSYLSLFQIVFLSGWTRVVSSLVDIKGKDLQPEPDSSAIYYVYVLAFIILGNFLNKNMFVGVIVNTFHRSRRSFTRSSCLGAVDKLLTENQKIYYRTMQKLAKKLPVRRVTQPSHRTLRIFYNITISKWFKVYSICIICASVVVSALESHGDSQRRADMWLTAQYVLQGLFTLEFLVKTLGLRKYYFLDVWNDFEIGIWLFVSIFMLARIVFEDINYLPMFALYSFRIFRTLKHLPFTRSDRNISYVMMALLTSAPALINIITILFVFTLIYAIIGVSLFSTVKHNGIIDQYMNFENIPQSLLLLFQLVSVAAYEEVMESLSIGPPECVERTSLMRAGNCGHKFFAAVFVLSFVLLTYILLINVFVAIVLESYENSISSPDDLFSEDDIEEFYFSWCFYDADAEQFLDLNMLPEFLDQLLGPTRIAKPNATAIACMDLHVFEGKKVHCLDVLLGITRIKVGLIENSFIFKNLCEGMRKEFIKMFPVLETKRIITTTKLIRQREQAALIIQRNLRYMRETKRIKRWRLCKPIS